MEAQHAVFDVAGFAKTLAEHGPVEGFEIEPFMVHMSGMIGWVSKHSRLMVFATPGWCDCEGIAVQATERNGDIVRDGFEDIKCDVKTLTIEAYIKSIRPILVEARKKYPSKSEK